MKTSLFTRWACVALFVAGNGLNAQSADFDAARQSIDERLENALAELDRVNRSIADERAPLSTEISELQQELVKLERRRTRLSTRQQTDRRQLERIRSQVGSLEDTLTFIGDRLEEFSGNFENRIDFSELQRYEEVISETRNAATNESLGPLDRVESQLPIVELASERLGQQLGGYRYPGEAYTADGQLVEGQFISLGPTVYFASTDGTKAGLVEKQLNRDRPVIVPMPPNLLEGIAELAATGQGLAPLDASGGRALKKAKASKSIGEYIEDGGVIGYVIIALGAFALSIGLLKVFEIMRFKTARPQDVDEIVSLLGSGEAKKAKERASAMGGTAGEMLSTGVDYHEEKRGTLEELLFEKVLKAQPFLERFLPFLAITAAASPLLGLLGTVVGMIKTFNLITIFGTGDAKNLSSGISEALVTTALGLIVAIPMLLLHGSLSRMAKRKLGTLEQGAVSFVNSIVSVRHRKEAGEPAPESTA
jgi:biopolymer transport protein ExbB